MRQDGNTYLNAKAVKHAHITGVKSTPNFHGTINEQTEGPISNIKSTGSPLGITSKPLVNHAVITVHDCALFIGDANEDLKKFIHIFYQN